MILDPAQGRKTMSLQRYCSSHHRKLNPKLGYFERAVETHRDFNDAANSFIGYHACMMSSLARLETHMWIAQHFQGLLEVPPPLELLLVRLQLMRLALAPSQPPKESPPPSGLLDYSRLIGAIYLNRLVLILSAIRSGGLKDLGHCLMSYISAFDSEASIAWLHIQSSMSQADHRAPGRKPKSYRMERTLVLQNGKGEVS